LALNAGLFVAAGVIDPDFTGAVKVVLHNAGLVPYTVRRGTPFAQFVLERFDDEAEIETVTSFDYETARGAAGFGSTDTLVDVVVDTRAAPKRATPSVWEADENEDDAEQFSCCLPAESLSQLP
jgi:hypothetical protein